MAADDLVKRNRDQILSVCAKHGAINVRVFGSFARGEAGPDSDVDLLVDVASEHSAWFPGGLLMDLQDLLGRKVAIVEPDGLHWSFRARVLKEAVPLCGTIDSTQVRGLEAPP